MPTVDGLAPRSTTIVTACQTTAARPVLDETKGGGGLTLGLQTGPAYYISRLTLGITLLLFIVVAWHGASQSSLEYSRVIS
jgi:hypothetical protein